MEESSILIWVGYLVLWCLVIGVPVLFFVIFLLPEDAYSVDARKTLLSNPPSGERVQVFVLGDIGRSPRMQYHALSLAKHGFAVDIVGYEESDIHPDVLSHHQIKIFPIEMAPTFLHTNSRILFLLFGPLKVIFQFFTIWHILGHRTRPAKWMLVQNPPSIPVLLVASSICWSRNTKLVVDWHNFGYSILALKLGKDHPLVRVSYWYERFWSRTSTANFVVSDAMNRELKRDFAMKSPIATLHDRPMGDFNPIELSQRNKVLETLEVTKGSVSDLVSGRAKLLVSSTSWTPDEDFSVLLEALVKYSTAVEASPRSMPTLLVVITGKGPQKAMYLDRISKMSANGTLKNVSIKTAWLSNVGYASLLAAADLGVSLHTSSSGVDLPMKVVDMFGAGLPVIGWQFEAWPELVKQGINGFGFSSTVELTDLLVRLFGADGKQLAKIKKGALEEHKHNWDREWNRVAGPVFGTS